ncbi:uncharacterized protein LOC121642504 [Melanotaenia boesemani]|uniref:uncharacterized protein LOC121642504 n=1 Tax=Melanotaenia boesemani TaxID=1250792 RepID=UPI001C04A081|nr:uncharacterized protein LOC121642504 [Melanotaenia boesemani]
MESTMDNDELTWSRQLPNSSSEDAESEHDIGHEQSNSRRERSNCSSQRSSYGSDGGRSTSLGSPPGHSFPRSGPLSLRERSNSPDRESSHGSDVGCSSCHSQSAVGSTPRCSSSRYGPSSSRREHHTSSNRRTSHGSAKHANPRHSTSGHETPRAPTDNSVDIFPMPTAKFQKCVLKKLVELTEEVKRIGCAEPSASTYHVRRMENMEQVDKLDELQNNEARDLLISQLSRVGGKNTRDCTTKILDRMMTNSLMSQFNMKGHGSKRAFQPTALYTIITAAVKKWDSKATDHEIKHGMAEHFKHAPGRSGGGGYVQRNKAVQH